MKFHFEQSSDNEITVVADGDGATISVADEKAVDSYNDVFECDIALPRDELVKLRDFLNGILDDRTHSLLADLYWQLHGLPAKHPQQLERRREAAELLGIVPTEQFPVSLAKMRQPIERAKNARAMAIMDAVAGQPMPPETAAPEPRPDEPQSPPHTQDNRSRQ